MSLRIVSKPTLRFFIGIDAVDFTWCAQTTHQIDLRGARRVICFISFQNPEVLFSWDICPYQKGDTAALQSV